MRAKISACIMTYNEEDNIRRCLESVSWCDEIVIVDSFSTDRTLEICRDYTERVIQKEWTGYIAQRNLTRKLATHEWILFLDADEEISPRLRESLIKEFEAGPGHYAGYEFPRQVYYLGKWIRHGSWYPDIKLRLFLKDRGRSGGVEPHDQVFVDGPIKRMRYPIYHYTYRDIADHLETMNRFSTISARSLYEKGRRFSWIDFMFRPTWRFFNGYFLRSGWLDGKRGLIIATINAFGVAMKYAKLWSIQRHEYNKSIGRFDMFDDVPPP